MPRHYSTQYNPSHYELPKHWPNFYTIGQNGLKYAKTHELLPPHYLNLSKKTYKKANTILKHDYQASNFVASISAALPPLYTVGYRQDIVQMSQTTPTLSVPYSFTHRNNKSQTKTYKGYFINDQAFYIKRPDEHISYFGVEIQNTSNTGEFTDDLTRSMSSQITQVRALAAEGITADVVCVTSFDELEAAGAEKVRGRIMYSMRYFL